MTPEIDREAARWLLRLQAESVSEQTFIDWQQWMAASDEHRAAYDRMEDTLLKIQQTPRSSALPTQDELDADEYDGSMPVSEWLANKAQARVVDHRRARRSWLAAAAAVFVIVMLASALALWPPRVESPQPQSFTYRTEPGQRNVITLPDHSKVTLDADSALEVRMSANLRLLVLARGEAFFQVEKDRTRPFTVRAGSTEVTAVGTAFNVRRSQDRTVVAVTEGKVEVVAAPFAPPRLTAQVSAGEAVSYVDDGNTRAIYASDASVATTWLAGRRQYRNEPLRYVLADIDRYTGRKIQIADETVGNLRFTGTLNLENSAGWLRGLAIALPVSIREREDGTWLIASRHESP